MDVTKIYWKKKTIHVSCRGGRFALKQRDVSCMVMVTVVNSWFELRNVPCSRLFLALFSLFPAVFRPVFPVPGCFRTNVPCSRLFFSQCSLFPAVFDHVPCSRLFFSQCSLFPAVLGPMFPVPGNPFLSPVYKKIELKFVRKTKNLSQVLKIYISKYTLRRRNYPVNIIVLFYCVHHDYKVSLDGIPGFCMLIRFPPPTFRNSDKEFKKIFKKVFLLKFSLIFEPKKKS